MRDWFGLVRAELLRISRRRLTWLLMAALIAASVLHGRALRTDLLDYRQAEQSGVGRFGQGVAPEVARATSENLERRMTFPGVLDEVWVTSDFWGLMALIILSALQAGEEFESGTARTLLLRGVSRAFWPSAKFVALAITAAVLWVGLAVTILPIGLWTEAQTGTGGGLAAVEAARWSEHAARTLRSWFTTFPYLAFSVWAATLARGAGPALALGLGGRFAEMGSTVAGTLLIGMEQMGSPATHNLYRLWAPLHVLSFEWSSQVVRTWGHPAWAQPLSPTPASSQVLALPAPFFDSPLSGVALLAGWTLVWLTLTAGSMRRRDITA